MSWTPDAVKVGLAGQAGFVMVVEGLGQNEQQRGPECMHNTDEAMLVQQQAMHQAPDGVE